MCWGAGILLSSGVVRAVVNVSGDMGEFGRLHLLPNADSCIGWRLPFIIQWVWPIPLFIGAYLAPESPWNAIRRGKTDLARNSLRRLRKDSPNIEHELDVTMAYIEHTTRLEKAETAGASFFECFRGTNLRRTEIVSRPRDGASRPLTTCRIALFGPLKFFAVTPFLATQSSSSRLPGSTKSRRSTSTSPSARATSSAVLFAGSVSYFKQILGQR